MQDPIMSHEEFVAQMERDKQARYLKGDIALLGVVLMIVFLMFAITQLAGGADVFVSG